MPGALEAVYYINPSVLCENTNTHGMPAESEYSIIEAREWIPFSTTRFTDFCSFARFQPVARQPIPLVARPRDMRRATSQYMWCNHRKNLFTR